MTAITLDFSQAAAHAAAMVAILGDILRGHACAHPDGHGFDAPGARVTVRYDDAPPFHGPHAAYGILSLPRGARTPPQVRL